MKNLFVLALLSLIVQSTNAQTIKDCASCNATILKPSQLKEKTAEELSLLRNEILARKGYKFTSNKYDGYFSQQDWYKTANNNSVIVLNATEQKNIALIKSLEESELKKRAMALKYLKDLKKALLDKNETVVNEMMGGPFHHEASVEIIRDLRIALEKIDLNNINWNKSSGLYRLKIDNGYAIYVYAIEFTQNTVTIRSGMESHSEIFGDFHDGYSDYMSENESTSFWKFKLTDGGLKFDAFDVAG